jgi:hypothetical protein
MARTRFILVVLMAVSLCARSALGGITDGLVGLYQFQNNLLDSSGSIQSKPGSPVNNPQFTAGKIGQAMWLPGVKDYMSLAASYSDFDFGSTTTGTAVDFSVSMWVRQDNGLSDPAVFSNKNWGSGANTGINWAVNGNGIFDLNTKGDSGSRRDLDTAANSASLGVSSWSLVVMTVDRDGPTKLYINGVNTGTIPVSSTGTFKSGLPWNVGQDGTGQYGVEFNGAVDELAIWRRALSAAEATQLWGSGAGIDLSQQTVDAALRLTIDRDTGHALIVNHTGAPQTLAAYEIDSAAGVFNPAAWTRIAGRLDASGNGSIDADDRWVVLSQPGSPLDLSEASLGSGLLQANGQIDLGLVWGKYFGDIDDIKFQYALANSDSPVTGVVTFTGNGGKAFEPLDLNFDGLVNISDYQSFLINYGSNLSGLSAGRRHNLGDLDGNGLHSVRDFLLFKHDFEARTGGSLAAAVAALSSQVAEPDSWFPCLAIGLSLAAIGSHRRG